MRLLTVILSVCFCAAFPAGTESALHFFGTHGEVRDTLTGLLGEGDAAIAMAIVAPEVALYSPVADFAEYRAMCLLYIQRGTGNFSLGYFQMKPRFAECIEREVLKNPALRQKYGLLQMESGSERACRKVRIDRLMQPGWQALYLAAFVDFVRLWTAGRAFVDERDKIRDWATRYNAGLYLSEEEVQAMQGVKSFPHFSRSFNYADAALDCYYHLTGVQHD